MQSNQTAKMSSSSNAIQIKWYENAAWDAPELKSPQPCIHGAGCVFTVKDADGKITPGCCRYVHPGEEGTGRRLFPERRLPDGRVQPACVRLTGAANQFYERRGRKIPWQQWCADKGIPFTPNKPGEKHEPVKKVAFGGKMATQVQQPVAQPVAQPMAAPTAYSEDQMTVFRALAEWREQNEQYQRISRNNHRAKKIINLPGAEYGMPTVVEMQPCCSNPSCGVTVFTPVPSGTRNPAIPAPIFFPPPLNLRPTNSSLDDDYEGSYSPSLLPMQRTGECSQDCTCPTGMRCGDVRMNSREGEMDAVD